MNGSVNVGCSTAVTRFSLLVLFSVLISAKCATQLCGIRPGVIRGMDEHIVGGKEAYPHSWPWQVHILYRGFLCGGTIIASRWIVTAAHCIGDLSPSKYKVTVGVHNTSATTERGRSVVPVAKVIKHKFKDTTGENDIALIYTALEIPFSKTVSPACLPTKVVSVGTPCVVTGFGYTSSDIKQVSPVLREVTLPIIDAKTCAKLMPESHIDASTLCASLPRGGKDSCNGDSGGPLVCQDGGKWIIHGLVSHGRGKCGDAGTAGVYTKIFHYVDWINEQMKQSTK